MRKDSLPLGSQADELTARGRIPRDRQCHYAFGIHLISTEADEGGLKRLQTFEMYL